MQKERYLVTELKFNYWRRKKRHFKPLRVNFFFFFFFYIFVLKIRLSLLFTDKINGISSRCHGKICKKESH